jgi:hypothetical protein
LGDPNDLENSEDCRGAGGHGNQHVRLRSSKIDCIEAICPAPEARLASSRGRRPIRIFRPGLSDLDFKTAAPDFALASSAVSTVQPTPFQSTSSINVRWVCIMPARKPLPSGNDVVSRIIIPGASPSLVAV